MHNKTLFPVVAITLAFACYAAPCHLQAQAGHSQPSTNTSQPPDNTSQPPRDAAQPSGNTAQPQDNTVQPAGNMTQPTDANVPSQSSNTNTAQATSEAAQMVPAQAQLADNLETKNLQPGEQFKAVLKSKVHLKNGVELPKGTALIGTVATESAPQGAKSDLALRFTQADLKNGQTVPIEATIVGVTPPATEDTAAAELMYNAPPSPWDGSTVQFDVNNALSGIDLHSKIAGQNSGVFTSDKSNLKLGARTQLALAIGPQGSATQGTVQPNGGY